jgi:hypothetical protein
MFWTLLLAHLLADFPLQTDRMVMAKKHLPGLAIHIGIHWVVMMLLFLPVIWIAWPFILVVVMLHFSIDSFKNFLGWKRPQFVIGSYILDQTLHMSSLLLVSYWMAQTTELPVWPVISPWVVYVIGLLLATYIWFVSERILVYRSDNRQMLVNSTMWPRMGTRLLLYLIVVAPLSFSWFLALLAIIIIVILYRRYNYLRSWLLIDIGIPVFSALLVRAILAIW